MNFTPLRAIWLVVACCVAVSCDSGPSADDADFADGVGQGEAVSSDPTFEIRINVEGGPQQSFAARQFAVYQSKPVKDDSEKELPQGFELRGDGLVLAGRLPDELKFAPSRRFASLVGQTLIVRSIGGDPTATSLSKLRFSDGRVYVARSGDLKVEKAFYRKGQYAGVGGSFEVMLQEIKEGNPDDPDNPRDTTVGDPVKAKGSFTSRADSFPFEQL